MAMKKHREKSRQYPHDRGCQSFEDLKRVAIGNTKRESTRKKQGNVCKIHGRIDDVTR
jgi:hypothetical protein